MYSVVYGGDLIYRSGSQGLLAQELHLAETESRPAEFAFRIPEENPHAGLLEARKAEVVAYDSVDGRLTEENEIFRGKITEIEMDFRNERRVECRGVLSYLMDSVQRQSEHHNKTVAQFLGYLLDRHNEQVSEEEKIYLGAVTVHDSNDSLYRYTNYETTLECIEEKLLDSLGGHLEIRRSGGENYLDYLADYRDTSSQPVEFGRNLLDFSKNMDASEIYTVCLPLGARQEESQIEALDAYLTIESVNNGKDYVENTEAIAIYGRRVKVARWDDVTLPENLKKKAEDWLVANQYENLSLEVTAVDLSMTGEDFESFQMGDETLVYSKPHGLNRRFPITARDRYFDDPEKNTITMGRSIVGGIVGAMNSGHQEAMDRLSKILSNNQLLTMAKNNATQLITAAMNGHVVLSPDEILIMDTPKKETANRVWRFNLAGLGYSKNGYNGPYETAMTMDGAIVADFITAGILSGIIIRSISDSGRFGTEIQTGTIRETALGKRLGIIAPYAPAWEPEPDLKGVHLGIVASEKSGGVRIYAGDENGNDAHTIAEFSCEESDRTRQQSIYYGKQTLYGETNLKGITNLYGAERIRDQSTGEWLGTITSSGGQYKDVFLCGNGTKNKVAMGYQNEEGGEIHSVIEASGTWTDYHARIWGGIKINGDMAATGAKNRIVDIGDKKILMNAYETADCMFGDCGSGLFDFKGELSVMLDETFRKTIEGDYSVFAYGYAGAATVKEKSEEGFTLIGQPGSRVDYEIRAKQKGYTDVRMKEFEEDENGEH